MCVCECVPGDGARTGEPRRLILERRGREGTEAAGGQRQTDGTHGDRSLKAEERETECRETGGLVGSGLTRRELC